MYFITLKNIKRTFQRKFGSEKNTKKILQSEKVRNYYKIQLKMAILPASIVPNFNQYLKSLVLNECFVEDQKLNEELKMHLVALFDYVTSRFNKDPALRLAS